MQDIWLPITEYSRVTGHSISTVRRRLKSQSLDYKKERGKYLIRHLSHGHSSEILSLRKKIQHLQEENEALSMLVKLYEKQLPQ